MQKKTSFTLNLQILKKKCNITENISKIRLYFVIVMIISKVISSNISC